RLGVLFAYLIHGVHHAFPEDRRRWLMPPIVTVPVATVLYFVLRLLVGAAAPPVFAGALFGYLAYDLLHYASHAGALRGRVPRYLRQHHLTHHYRMPETRFGVSSPFWDRGFGTLRSEHPRGHVDVFFPGPVNLLFLHFAQGWGGNGTGVALCTAAMATRAGATPSL